eukprot:TRINITY_DN7299_c0_g1_i1.p1 TRINITY_DN7299_c0_g1~~TRINITY_DN7299_c0_g1_i1.p1  ORF type:complete len:300 (+),score=49.32 TRINITY_DN7299_c0_g1_i1:241-1140(+)
MSSSIPFVLLDEDMATADGKKIMPLLEEQEHDGDMEEPMGWGRGWWIVTGVGSLLVLGGLVWLLLLLTGGNSSSRNNLKILWMSDIHMDQWYNGSLAASCHCNPASVRPSLAISDAACAQEAQASGYLNGYSKPGCCSSRRLVESMMDDAVSTIPSPDLVLITGDYTRHSTSLLPDSLKNQTVMEAVSNVTVMVVDRFGGSSAVLLLPSELHTAGLVLGNNDFLPDYGLPDNQWSGTAEHGSCGSERMSFCVPGWCSCMMSHDTPPHGPQNRWRCSNQAVFRCLCSTFRTLLPGWPSST